MHWLSFETLPEPGSEILVRTESGHSEVVRVAEGGYVGHNGTYSTSNHPYAFWSPIRDPEKPDPVVAAARKLVTLRDQGSDGGAGIEELRRALAGTHYDNRGEPR